MAEEEKVAPSEAELNKSLMAGYNRVANPNQEPEPAETPVEKEEVKEEVKATETPPDPLDEIRSQVGKIPDVLKQLNDVNGRYGRLTQRFEELQTRLATPSKGAAEEAVVDIEDLLKDIKEDFGEEGLYKTLKTAFSKVLTGKSVDPQNIEKMVADRIEAEKQAEKQEAIDILTEERPTWVEDRKAPEFKEWMETLPAKERKRFEASMDPYYVAGKLDEFDTWKASKNAKPEPKPESKPEVKLDPKPNKRLANAVMPTTGTKPKPSGEDDKATSIRAGYDRVAGARIR